MHAIATKAALAMKRTNICDPPPWKPNSLPPFLPSVEQRGAANHGAPADDVRYNRQEPLAPGR